MYLYEQVFTNESLQIPADVHYLNIPIPPSNPYIIANIFIAEYVYMKYRI